MSDRAEQIIEECRGLAEESQAYAEFEDQLLREFDALPPDVQRMRYRFALKVAAGALTKVGVRDAELVRDLVEKLGADQ